MKLSDVKPYPRNAKKHPKEQVADLAAIVKEVGWRQPIVVNQKGMIVVGHGRWEAWKYRKDLKPVWIIDDKGKVINGEPETAPLTEAQEKAYRLADNKLNESEWNMELALDELKELPADMLKLTGFDLGPMPDAQAEIDPKDLGDEATLSFTFDHERYMAVLEALSVARDRNECATNEEALWALLEPYV